MRGKQANSKHKKNVKNIRSIKTGKPVKVKRSRVKDNGRYYAKAPKKRMGRRADDYYFDSEEPARKKVRFQKKTFVKLGILAGVLLCLAGAAAYIQKNYTVTNIYVEGNVHYTNEEIQNMVMGGVLGNNSLYLSLKYKDKEITDIPFIETMSVKIMAPDTIRISVYEKALAGYVEYLGRYMYFDREGIIVESSEMKTQEIPQVTGLQFNYVVLHEMLPVENEEIFNQILDITQLLTKYGITADRIYFDKNYDMTLYFGDAKVRIGGNEYIDEKIMKLQYLLPELIGKSGTLHMENYSEDMKNITFNLDSE